MKNGIKEWIYTKDVKAESSLQAFEKACIRLSPDRIMEMQQVEATFERPPVARIEREGLI